MASMIGTTRQHREDRRQVLLRAGPGRKSPSSPAEGEESSLLVRCIRCGRWYWISVGSSQRLVALQQVGLVDLAGLVS